MDIKAIRKANLERLLSASPKPKQASLAARLKKKPSQISQWLSHHRSINETSARQIETSLGLEPGWMDLTETGLPPVPILGPEPQQLSAVLRTAVASLGEALRVEMPDDVRDDVADALAKLARRKGTDRDQGEVLRLIDNASKKQSPRAA